MGIATGNANAYLLDAHLMLRCPTGSIKINNKTDMPPAEQSSKNPKQQVAERLKTANNVLVTVSNNPSVDQLAAAIGLTLLLNRLGKHATAVFSGTIPSTIQFLQPEKTIEKNTDSLRDFIIALDKAKADKLRYKVEDKVVKIFITPYRTSLSEKDLVFSQGDFNVDVVMALGVHQQSELDQAITSHGRILHDAAVISVNNHNGSNIGTVHWLDNKASSLCEMIVDMAAALGQNLMDNQMATAFLTGIVAETDRFSNEKTSPNTMSISSKLMAAGANQQLIATKLDTPKEAPPPESNGDHPPASGQPAKQPSPPKTDDGSLTINHDDNPKPQDISESNAPDTDGNGQQAASDTIHIDEQGTLHVLEEAKPDKAPLSAESEQNAADSKSGNGQSEDNDSRLYKSPHMVLQPPTLGGKLTANTEPEQKQETSDPLSLPPVNAPLLSHDSTPAKREPISASDPADSSDGQSLEDIERAVHSPHLDYTPVEAIEGDGNLPPHPDEARKAVEAAAPVPLEPIQALGAQYLGDNLNSPADATVQPASQQPSWPSFVPQGSDLSQAPSDTTAPPEPPPSVPPPMVPPPFTP